MVISEYDTYQHQAKETLENLGRIIFSASQALRREESHPGFSPDQSDDTMRHLRERIANLRHIRGELEDELSKG